MHSGYALPDFGRYLARSTALYSGITPLTQLQRLVEQGMHSGTLGPLALLPLLPWVSQPPPAVVHSFEILGLIFNFGTFYVLVFRLTRSNISALFAVFLTFCSIEFRLIDDPYLTNLLVVPFAAELLLLALVAYVSVGRDRSWSLLAISGALFAAAVAVLPSCAPLALVFMAYAWWAKGLMPALPDILFFCIVGICALLAVDQDSFAVCAIGLGAFVKHILSALPVTYRAVSGIIRDRLSTTDRDTSFDHVPQIGLGGWIVAFSCAITAFAFLARSRDRKVLSGCLVVGAALWLGGAAFPEGGSVFSAFGFAMVCTGLFPLISRLRPAF